jgi:hypothetical protein
VGIASALVISTGVGVAAAVDRSGGSTDQQVTRAAPLSALDRKALAADRALIESLPDALAQVPQAAADAAGIDSASARAYLADVAALQPLTVAVDGHSSAVSVIVTGYRALLTSGTPTDAAGLPQAIETLQTVEGDVVPAVRLVALRHGHQLSAAAALTAVERDPRTATLARLLADWSVTYGALVLMEQAAAG